MPMKNPPHPGKSIMQDCLQPFDLSITAGARILGVSPEMAIRLSKAFGSTPQAWLKMQPAYDLAQAERHASKIKVKRFEPA